MARRYLLDPLPGPGDLALPDSVAHHLARVMRVEPGEEIVLFDGTGHECRATVLAVEHGRVRVRAAPATPGGKEPMLRLELAVALPKGTRAEWLFEHGTEVGITVFRPILCTRNQERSAARAERWRRIVAAAAAQCDRALVPEVADPIPLATLLKAADLPAQRWFGAQGGEAPPGGREGRGLLVVGPEGGFTAEEDAALRRACCAPICFSQLTWRTETAAVVGAALLLA